MSPETLTPKTGTAKEKRDLERATLRPLANRRPELYDEDEYTSADYERMMDLYQGSLASIDEGEIVKAKVQSVRDNVVVHEGKLSQLKRFKDDVREVTSGMECGMAFENYQDMRQGDVIECYRVETVQRSL